MQSCKYIFVSCFIFVNSDNIKYLYLYKSPVISLLRPKFGYKKKSLLTRNITINNSTYSFMYN